MKSFYNNTILNLLVVVLISFTSVFSQDAIDSVAVQKGEQIFKANCTSCHVMGETKLIGPGLKGVTDRRKKEWLKKWINSSSDFIASGDPDAIAIYEEYDKVAMTSYYFEDDDFESLYAYLQNPPVKKEVVAADIILAQEDG
jgi:mono/diheme cytochrome c family protein